MAVYKTRPLSTEQMRVVPLANVVSHLDVWGKTLVSATYDNGDFVLSIEPALTEDEVIHLDLEVLE